MSKLVLEANEVCPYAQSCVYNNNQGGCYGAKPNRKNKFVCNIVDTRESGGAYRNPLDKTGKMELLVD